MTPLSNPYQVYGLYLHPSGDETVQQADPEKKQMYENKGFTFLAFVPAPGVTPAGPRDIDRNDSGLPAGPDGSTHERHPWEITPDGQPVPWGFPLVGVGGVNSTKVTRTQMRSMGLDVQEPKGVDASGGSGGGQRGAAPSENLRQREERRIMGILKEKGIPDERPDPRTGGTVKGNHKRIVGMALAHLRDPEEEMEQLSRDAVPAGEVIAKGVTRGVAGIDVTMPSVVPGIAPTDQTGQRAAAARGEIEYEDRELEGGYVLRVPRAAKGVGPVGGPTDAPGDAGAASRPSAPDPPDVTTEDQARHQQVRETAMQQEAKDEGRVVEPPKVAPRPSQRPPSRKS
jgi:hypothetical protein